MKRNNHPVEASQPPKVSNGDNIEEVAVETELVLPEEVASSTIPLWEPIPERLNEEDMPIIAVENTSSSNGTVLFQPVPETISLENRQLMLYFSQHIAAEMIAFDGPHNGRRHLILPLAQTDDLVLNAVLTAADAHQRVNNLSPQGTQMDAPDFWHPNSSQLYVHAICGLRERQELVHGDQRSRCSIITTIMVLLSAVMVAGSYDFPVLFRMLESAIEAMGGRKGLGQGEYADFLLRQVSK